MADGSRAMWPWPGQPIGSKKSIQGADTRMTIRSNSPRRPTGRRSLATGDDPDFGNAGFVTLRLFEFNTGKNQQCQLRNRKPTGAIVRLNPDLGDHVIHPDGCGVVTSGEV